MSRWDSAKLGRQSVARSGMESLSSLGLVATGHGKAWQARQS